MDIINHTILRNGNMRIVTTRGIYEIGNNADTGQPYGICLPNHSMFIPITKGKGKKAYVFFKDRILIKQPLLITN